jgi:hypothetical protein
VGNYLSSTFVTASDGHGGTFVTDPPAAGVTISGTSQAEIEGASNENVTFAAGATGELMLSDSAAFTGSISGFTGTSDGNPATSDKLDLRDINFASETASYANNVLTVTDGTHTAQINFIGSYTLANFFFSDDNGGTLVTDPPAAGDRSAPIETAAGDGNPTGTQASSTAALCAPGANDWSGFPIHPLGTSFGSTDTLAQWPSAPEATDATASGQSRDRTLALLGQYMASSFADATGGHASACTSDPQPYEQHQLSLPHAG